MDAVIDTPAANGIDKRNEIASLDSRRALDLNNLDILRGDAPESTRIGPRRWTRRIGEYVQALSVAIVAGPGITGAYKWIYIWTDAGGVTHWSDVAVSATSLANEKGRISGWPASGTVAIYRTVASGSTYKLVVTGLDAAANPTYDDATADGALGADAPARALRIDPYGNDTFNQSVLTELLLVHRNALETYRMASILAGGSLYRMIIGTDASAPEAIRKLGTGGTAPTGYPLSAAILGNKLWIADSGGLRWSDLNAYASTGSAAASQPAQPTINSVTPGGVGAITTTVGWTYVLQKEDPDTGVRSIPSAPMSTGPFAGKANVVIAYTGSGTIHVYRTSDGGQFFQFVATDTNGSPYTDTTLDSSLSQQQVPFEVGAAVKWAVVFAHKGILFGLNQTDSSDRRGGRIGWTSSLYPHNWPIDPLISADFSFDVDPNDGDQFVAGYSWGEVALCWKRRRVYMVSGDPPTGFRWSPLPGSRDKGTTAPRTIAETSIGVLYYSPAGVCLIPAPGAAPIVVSDAIRDVLVEAQQLANRPLTATLSEEPAQITFDYTPTAAPQTINVRVQLDTDPAFGSIDFDYDTTDAAERPYFLATNAAFPAAGYTLSSLAQRVRIALRPPTSGGPTAGTAYHVRYAVNTGAGWSTWTTLADFTLPTDNPYEDTVDANKLIYAHAVHYPARQEYWLWLPTGGRQWADTAWILDYSAAEAGNLAGLVWRRATVPATAAAFVDNWSIDSLTAADHVLIADPDGLLFTYPFTRDGIDRDTRETVAAADRRVSATLAGSTLTASGTTWPTSRYGLKGALTIARDANGLTYTGLITANTATTLTITWLSGRNPPAGALTITVGGLDAFADLPWLRLTDEGYSAVLRTLGIRAASPQTTLYCIIRTAAAARRRLSEAVATRIALPIGAGFEQVRHDVHRWGHYHQLRIGTIDDSQLWEIQALELDIEPTGART